MKDDLGGLIGRMNGRIRAQEGLVAALRVIDALWYSADRETRERARKWTGFEQWLEAIRRAVDWS